MDRKDVINNIKMYGNRGGRYIPQAYDICYPIYTREFARVGFSEICPTLTARDYKDPKWVIIPNGDL